VLKLQDTELSRQTAILHESTFPTRWCFPRIKNFTCLGPSNEFIARVKSRPEALGKFRQLFDHSPNANLIGVTKWAATLRSPSHSKRESEIDRGGIGVGVLRKELEPFR